MILSLIFGRLRVLSVFSARRDWSIVPLMMSERDLLTTPSVSQSSEKVPVDNRSKRHCFCFCSSLKPPAQGTQTWIYLQYATLNYRTVKETAVGESSILVLDLTDFFFALDKAKIFLPYYMQSNQHSHHISFEFLLVKNCPATKLKIWFQLWILRRIGICVFIL